MGGERPSAAMATRASNAATRSHEPPIPHDSYPRPRPQLSSLPAFLLAGQLCAARVLPCHHSLACARAMSASGIELQMCRVMASWEGVCRALVFGWFIYPFADIWSQTPRLVFLDASVVMCGHLNRRFDV